MADFIAEFALGNGNTLAGEQHPKDAGRSLEKRSWALYVDGAANSRGSGLGIVLISPEGELLEESVRLGFGASNNEAEYEAILHGLRAARQLSTDPLTLPADSQSIDWRIHGKRREDDSLPKVSKGPPKRLPRVQH